MAEIVKKSSGNSNSQQKHVSPDKVEKPVEEKQEHRHQPASIVTNPTDEHIEYNKEDVESGDVATVLASAVSSHDPRFEPCNPTAEEYMADRASAKDQLMNNHAMRINGKRKFVTDILCRALGAENYMMEVDKAWGKNPLGKGPNVSVRYTREFPAVYILFDKYDLMPDPRIVELKKKLANEHGYKYIYETPELLLNHAQLTIQLDSQKTVRHPDLIEADKIIAERNSRRAA